MTLTIELTAELEAQLREEAAKSGHDTTALVVSTLQERFGKQRRSGAEPLSQEESILLQKINQGLTEEIWNEYHI